jgi:hypothetical protein
LFTYMYLIGLLIGLGCYSITYLFAKDTDNSRRVLVVFILGAICLLGSLTIIGGFEGMPYGVLSLGIITVSILMAFLGKNLIWKKSVYTVIILFVVLFVSFDSLNKVDYWVGKKRNYGDDVYLYTQHIQKDTTIRGYNTFTISEGNKGIVLSLGNKMADNNIEVLDVKEQGSTTVIKIRTFYNQSTEKNPWIMIGFNRLKSNIVIMDTDGTLYEEVAEVK